MHYEKDPSGTDVLWQVYSIRVRGFVTSSSTSFPGVGETLITAATLNDTNQSGAQAIKSALETPRKSCLYSINGQVVVQTGGGAHPGVIDAHLGPWPQKASCVPVSSGTFMVECGFDVAVVECKENCPDSSRDPVVSIRWTQSETIDETWHSRITTRGRLIVRSDLLQQADNFRSRCTPGLLSDYRRLSAEYTLSPSGTELDFAFVDLEVDFMPPALAVKASGRFTVLVTSGAQRMGQVDLKLTGVKGARRGDLLRKAITMGYAKLQLEGLMVPVINGSFAEDLFVNEIEISMQAILQPMINAGGIVAETSGGIAVGVGAGGLAGFAIAGPPGAIIGGLIGGGVAAFLPSDPPAVVGAAADAANRPPQVLKAPGEMPGVVSPVNGLRPPDRVRLAHLTAAAFRDPCACLAAATETTMTATTPTTTTLSTSPITPTPPGTPPATYKRTPLPPLPTGPAVVADPFPYDHYKVESTYSFDSGKLQMPGTGVGPNANKSTFLTRTGQIATLQVVWTASRRGVPPVLPSFNTPDPNYVPMKASISPMEVEPSADNINMKFTVSGAYVYGVEDPAKITILCPVPPFLSDAAGRSGQVGAASFSDQVLWKFVGTTNPFVSASNSKKIPDNSVAASLAAPVFAQIGLALAGGVQPSGLQQGGNGNLVSPPPVGP